MLITLLEIFSWVFYIYDFIILAHIIFSWIPNIYNYKIPRVIGNIGGWFLRPFSGWLVVGPIDLTPIIGFFVYGCACDALNILLIILKA